MKNIAVIFGGKSVEHDISILTGLQVISNLSGEYNVIPIYISRTGEWWTGEKLTNMSTFTDFNEIGLSKCWLVPHSDKLFMKKFIKIREHNLDNIILALHGANGEDGTVQGLIELCEIPYTSAGVLGSALTMDKVVSKMIMKECEIATPEFLTFYKHSWQKNKKQILKEIKEKFKNNVVVKPARAGSSIGVSKCANSDEVKDAIDLALCFDFKIIVEQAISDFREVNVACIGLEDDVEVSVLEEIKGAYNILDFDKKYINSKSVERVVDVKLDKKIKDEICTFAKKIFTACECMGVVRLDFFVENKTNKVLLNEINSIPGSMANYLFKNMNFTALLDKLLALSEKRQKQKENLSYLYKSDALINFNVGGKVKK